MSKLLIVVDMQNDFIDGALGTPEAQKIVEPMAEFIRKWEGSVVFTRDTHAKNYLETNEGKHLPIKHCIENTDGWQINKELREADAKFHLVKNRYVINKDSFALDILKIYQCTNFGKIDEIYLCGVCTDICVVCNAIHLKAYSPETPVYVISSLCAGTTPENHEAALKVMRSCQIEVI